MKAAMIRVGETYRCRIENEVVPIRVDAAHEKGGWIVSPVAGGEQVHVIRHEQFRDIWHVPDAIEPQDEGELDMKKDEIAIGSTYTAKVSDKVVRVRIDAENRYGGWDATNLETGKKVRIKTAQRLRREVTVTRKPTSDEAGATGEKVVRGKKAAKKAGATASDRPARAAKATKPAGEPKPKRVSALDAAAQVLQAAGKPMSSSELIVAMAEQGLWSSPNGKTPAATLYAAMLREIGAKGKDARFRKADRGQFEYVGGAA